MSGAIEASTLRNYTNGLKKFSNFLAQTDVGVPFPSCLTSSALRSLITEPGVIEAFICFCFKGNLAADTAGGYIDGLKHFATDLDGSPFFPRERIILRMLTGYHKLGKRPSPPKCGIDVIILRRLMNQVSLMDLGADKPLWRAMFSVAFFGCFRVSEFLVSKDELKLLSFNKVRIAGDSMEFVLEKTKNNTSGPPQLVLFGPLPGDIACPVSALRAFISVRRSSKSTAAFFIDSMGMPVTSARFNMMLRKALQCLGTLQPNTYSAKSFRIGAASMCYSLNMPIEDIQALGRWASQAFMYYIRAGARAVRARSIQKKLADGF